MVNTGRYEMTEGTSYKFWELRKVGVDAYEARWGRIGTAGQGPKVYDTAKAEKVVVEKTKKGYVLVSRF